MFGKRKHSSDETKEHTESGERQDRQEGRPQAGRAPAAGVAERPLPRSAASSTAQSGESQDSQRSRGPSRPDANAVLGRQPTPPVVPETPRRATDFTAARRTPERRQVQGEEGQRLIVGRNISLSGEIKTCEKLVVEGEVDAELTDSRSLEITDTGLFKGKAVVDEVEVAGKFEGELTARKRLYVRASGQLSGHVRFGELEIERGGRIAGTIEELEVEKTETADSPAATESKDKQTSEEDASQPAAEKSEVKAAPRENGKAPEKAEAAASNGNGNGNDAGAGAEDSSANGAAKKEGEREGQAAKQPNGTQPAQSQGEDSAPKTTAASG